MLEASGTEIFEKMFTECAEELKKFKESFGDFFGRENSYMQDYLNDNNELGNLNNYKYMRSKSSFKRILLVLSCVNNFTNNGSRKKFQKMQMLTFCCCLRKQKFRQHLTPQNSSFFAFEVAISSREVPQQHHLSQQHFERHVA